VQDNANEIATTGAAPRRMMVTVLLPEGPTTSELVDKISAHLYSACRSIGVSLIGGHTEITYGLDRPILSATMIGEVERQRLVTPAGAKQGDCLLLTKGVPIEATSILAREFPGHLTDPRHPAFLSEMELQHARDFLHLPGISVLKDAQTAIQAGRVHAMHDPTEGGLLTALWELAQACGRSLKVDLEAIHIPDVSGRICQIMGINPLAAIASGALLMAVEAEDAPAICSALAKEQIPCNQIGEVLETNPHPQVWQMIANRPALVSYPARDEIAGLFET
jgi:hydrogenase maturation factor